MKKTIIFGLVLISILILSGCAQQSYQPSSQPINSCDKYKNLKAVATQDPNSNACYDIQISGVGKDTEYEAILYNSDGFSKTRSVKEGYLNQICGVPFDTTRIEIIPLDCDSAKYVIRI